MKQAFLSKSINGKKIFESRVRKVSYAGFGVAVVVVVVVNIGLFL